MGGDVGGDGWWWLVVVVGVDARLMMLVDALSTVS
jgi:hypothetical protein